MSENLSTNVELDSTANGTVSFATDVVATIAGLAATEVEGVAAMINTGNMGLVDMLRKNQGNRPLTRGVKIDIDGNKVTVQLTITVDYGSPVPDVAREIQDNVKKAIETMTGLDVPEINIYVQGISFEKENKAAAALEQKQHAAINAQKVEQLSKGNEESATESDETRLKSDDGARRIFRFGARHQSEAPATGEKPAEPAPAATEQPAPADEPAEPHADQQPADDKPDSTPTEPEQPETYADIEDEQDEDVCDGHCETCELECDAAGKTADDEQDGDADAAECEFECENGGDCPLGQDKADCEQTQNAQDKPE